MGVRVALFRSSNQAPAGTRPPAAPRILVSAATLVSRSSLTGLAKVKPWQTAAWEMYDEIGELHSAVGWLAHSLSRARLYVADMPEGGAPEGDPVPTENTDAIAALDELFGGPAGHPQMLSRFAVHLTVPGESYLIGLDLDAEPVAGDTAPAQPSPVGPDGQPVEQGPRRRWLVASSDEFTTNNGKVSVRLPDSDREVEVDLDRSTVIRLWRPHARRAWDADSPTRACLGALRELVTASARINADLESRLAGAGMLVMPSSATVARQGAPDDGSPGGEQLVDDEDYATLIEAMVTPISDRDSASAVVPILVRVDDTAVDKVRHISFATPLDGKVQDLREASIKRLALGLDVPPEVLLGMTDANHWTGWQIEESAVKLSVEPLLTLIVNALTESYLRPALVALGVANPERYAIWYDVSELVLRPNRFEQALKLYAEGMISIAAVLREGGFAPEDVPNSTEQARHLLLSLVRANVSPDVARPYLLALGLPAPEALDGEVGDAAPPAGPPAIEGDVGDDRALPDTEGNPDSGQPGPVEARVATALTAAAAGDVAELRAAALELAVLRALEIAGKRLLSAAGRQYRGQLPGPAWSLHTHPALRPRVEQLDGLLAGAYDTLRASPLGRAPETVELVDGYVRELLLAGVPHQPAYLGTAIAQYAARQGRADAAA
jgi:hypothetical protein